MLPELWLIDIEFYDPIAYISMIEEKASKFGIHKMIPPLPKPSNKYVFFLSFFLVWISPFWKRLELGQDNSSLGDDSAWKTDFGDGSSDGILSVMFTTMQQEVGQNVKKN